MIAVNHESTDVASLLVFSDDWGRHPSSCQHLVWQLLDRYPVTWVNTIGTRTPRLNQATLRRVREKLVQWHGLRRWTEMSAASRTRVHPNLQVVNPKMWPWFSRPHDRRLNQWWLRRQLTPLIERMPQPVVALTTLPVTSDLVGVLPVSRWVYYCVDDFSEWPGLDGDTLRRMDVSLIDRADSLVAVSRNLQAMIARQGRSSELLTHGVDVKFWSPRGFVGGPVSSCPLLRDLPQPCVVFWGVIDRRLQTESLLRLSRDLLQEPSVASGTIVLVGPQDNPDPALLTCPNLVMRPAQPIDRLPEIAHAAGALIMPYADLPVTRAMQPLKLREYLATGRPVVVNRLPSTQPWADCLDNADSPEEFSRLVRHRLAVGTPAGQLAARRRLEQESWSSRAELLDQILRGGQGDSPAEPKSRPQPNLTLYRAENS